MSRKTCKPLCNSCVPCLRRKLTDLEAKCEMLKDVIQANGHRISWENNNSDQFHDDFKTTQAEGCKRYGMKFVQAQAQEAALAQFGGIFPQFKPSDFVWKALISRMVLAVLNWTKEK